MPIKTLDASHDERHTLDPSRPGVRESVAWVLPLVAEGIGLVAYTWVDAFGVAGVAGIAYGPAVGAPIFERHDGIQTPEGMGFDAWEAGPMRFGHIEPLKSSRIDYRGERLAMEFTFEGSHPPYAYSSHPEPFPSYFADDRFEQSGRAKGTITIDGKAYEIDGACHRDHSWGARIWAASQHFKWFNFMTPDSSVHVMDLSGFGRSTIRGYVDRDGITAEIASAEFEYELDDDLWHRKLSAVFEDDAGRTTRASLTSSVAELGYPISPHMTLNDLVGEIEVEGTPGVGYVEMSWPPEYLANNVAVPAAAPAAA